MLPALLILGVIILLFLVLRFMQPELIYSVRHVLVLVRTNKAFLDSEAGREVVKTTFPQLLEKDLRYETIYYDERYVMRRLMKIRELYQMLDANREQVPGITGERKPQVCITELASLLENFSKRITPETDISDVTIGANSILLFLGNEIKQARNEPQMQKEEEVERWFTDNPISIEQTIEMLIAAVFALAYRQRRYGNNNHHVVGSILNTD